MSEYTGLLLRIAKENDRMAFKLLVEKFSQQLHTYALVFVKNSELAEEIVSDVWVKIWKNRTQLDNITYISPYLYKAVKNQSLTYNSQLERISLADVDDFKTFSENQLTTEYNPLQRVEEKELRSIIDESVRLLPQNGQAAFRLIRQEGYSYKEAAEELGISVNTVKTHLRRSLMHMRTRLKRHLPDFIPF